MLPIRHAVQHDPKTLDREIHKTLVAYNNTAYERGVSPVQFILQKDGSFILGRKGKKLSVTSLQTILGTAALWKQKRSMCGNWTPPGKCPMWVARYALQELTPKDLGAIVVIQRGLPQGWLCEYK